MGQLIIISSPSGGGKDAAINQLLEIFPNSARLITTTTRPPRPGEKNGVNYYFVSEPEFKKKISKGDFIEYNLYAGNLYGTERARVFELLSKFDPVFTNIEVNGKQNFDKAGIKNLSIFLMPENLEVLKERIRQRGGIDKNIMEKRMKTAENELEQSKIYDFRVLNKQGKLAETVREIAEIIRKTTDGGSAVDK